MAIRSYSLQHAINQHKLVQIAITHKRYQQLAQRIANEQWKLFNSTQHFDEEHDIKHLPKILSERYKQTCQDQVVGILNSFISNKINDFVEYVAQSSLPDKVKSQLYQINKRRKWYTNTLAKAIWRLILKRNRKPRFHNINMALDNKVAVITPNDGKSSYDYWINFSTHVLGKPIHLPLITNTYYEKVVGQRNNFCQINKNSRGEYVIRLCKDKAFDKEYKARTPLVALDSGLKIPFAGDDGKLFGQNFYRRLSAFDHRLTILARIAQQRNLLPTHVRRYRLVRQRFQAWYKNEFNRIINKIVKLYAPDKIILENLFFNNQNLSKRMNRLLTYMGRRLLKAKLTSLEKEKGIKHVFVNPAYTSKECSACGYIDERNRKSRDEFVCKHCGKRLHADVNGARCIFARSSDKEITIYVRRAAVLRILCKRFLERRLGRHDSLAPGLLKLLSTNPYFKDLLVEFQLKPKGVT